MKSTIKALFDWAVYLLSFAVPRNRDVWIFLGWRNSKEREVFAENPKYQFLYTVQNRPDIRAIWIGQDRAICELLRKKGYEAHPIKSFQGIYYSLRAGYTFIGALLRPENWRYSGGTRIIQLWHSKSLKKTGFNSPYSLSRYNRFLFGNLFKTPFRFVAISRYLAHFTQTDFNIHDDQLLITGLPKHDVLLNTVKGAEIDKDEALENLIEKAREMNPRRVLFYGPTFRPDGSNPLANLDFAALNSHLQKTNDVLILSLHPKFSAKSWIPEHITLDRILFSQSDFDIYPVMPKLDVLITDYSSLTMDFLFMGKPIILYAFDMDTFKEGMGVYEDLWELMPGPKVFAFEQLLGALEEDLSQYTPSMEKARSTLFDFTDSNASERIANTIL